jgi:pimeloyl-ACP methyl ester carboxylesterase
LRSPRFRRLCATALLAAGACLLPVSGTATAAPVSCQDLRVPVTLAGTPQTMYGRLCVPDGAKTVQVLIPGGTYNSSYWDIAYGGGNRSYRLGMNKAGIATLAVDRLGTGQSSKPLSVLVTATAQATAVHQVIQTLRPRFAKVIVGGHSIGSAMALIEAGLHHDVDGVLVTGLTHKLNVVTVAPVLANMIPAPLDPQLASRGLDLGYLTTRAGTRYSAFHEPGANVAGAIAEDESTKDVFAATEAVDTLLLTNVVIPFTKLITVPVLMVEGNDRHYCGPPLGMDCATADALRVAELPYFSASARLSTFILDGYGHAINYAPNASVFHQAIATWTKSLG